MAGAPLIGVTTSVTTTDSPERAYVNASYLRAVQQAGGIPVLLPPHLDDRARAALSERLDGLLLTGGGDLDPARFGEPRHPSVYEVSGARDALELDVVDRALARRRPLLAVCRGIQVLNVALGGTLYQDIPTEPGSPIAHSQKAPRQEPTHGVTVRGETRLAGILGAGEVAVNSLHHQAIKRLGRGLRDVAWAPDGIVEGVELPDAPALVVGVQWHPEELVGHDEAARRLFRALVDAASTP
jgi:putative glutamine amidotransferase